MDVSKFIFRKETQKKLEKDNRYSVGEKRWEKLKELEDSGELTKLETTADIVEALGYDRNNITVLSWVERLIRKGNVRGEPIYGKPHHYSFYTVFKPNYDKKAQAAIAREGKKRKALKEMSTPIRAAEVNPQPKSIIKPDAQPATTADITVATKQSDLTMTVHYGDLTIEFRGITQETINSLIDRFTNKTN